MWQDPVIVVGAGPAGLMAAGQAAGSGVATLLLEKMDRPGRKLILTGKGRCNLTNEDPLPDFIAHFGPNGRFLRQAFSRFFSQDLLTFFEEMGVYCTRERGGRLFLSSGRADDAVDALRGWATRQGAIIQTHASVERLVLRDGMLTGVQLKTLPHISSPISDLHTSPRFLPAAAVIIATGGASYPHTGSDGDGYRLAGDAGHQVIPIRPALVPLVTAGLTARKLQGLSLRNVTAKVYTEKQVKLAEAFGEMLFTHFGLSGPIILSLSKVVVDALRNGQKVEISIDLKPALSNEKLDARLLRDLNAFGSRQLHTLLKELLPQKLIPVCLELTRLSAGKPAHQITAQERKILCSWMKDFRLQVTGHRSFAQAIVTAGGVDINEIDPRSMSSRLVKGLYFAGEVLDLDADTGGYNLQAAFSTGWLAGLSAAEMVKIKIQDNSTSIQSEG
jgi:predicted Rossmann fold flavoprotein